MASLEAVHHGAFAPKLQTLLQHGRVAVVLTQPVELDDRPLSSTSSRLLPPLEIPPLSLYGVKKLLPIHPPMLLSPSSGRLHLGSLGLNYEVEGVETYRPHLRTNQYQKKYYKSARNVSVPGASALGKRALMAGWALLQTPRLAPRCGGFL
jgi:hypothetical protein